MKDKQERLRQSKLAERLLRRAAEIEADKLKRSTTPARQKPAEPESD
jgi:hypothetical protein